jgi:hypothetical protein
MSRQASGVIPAQSARAIWPKIGGIGILVLVAAGVGAASTTTQGIEAVGLLSLLAMVIGAVIWFGRDPTGVFIGIWLIEVAQAPLSAAVGYESSAGVAVRQSSDVMIALILGLAIWRSLSRERQTSLLRVVIPGCLLLLIGLLSAFANHASASVSIQGMWLGIKFWTLIAVAVLLPWQARDPDRIYRALMVSGLIVAFLGLVEYFGHGIVATALHTNLPQASIGSYRANAVQSILSFPGEFSLFMSLMVAVSAARYMSRRRLVDLALFLLFTISVFLSLRLKGVLSIGAVIIVVALCRGRANRSNFVPAVLLGVLLGIFAFSFEGTVISRQVEIYSPNSGTTARGDLYRVGAEIADDDFPLGVGFGRFASDTSRTHYSNVYDEYGLSGIYGLERSYPNYIDDTTWPSVMGETGYAGFLAYVLGLLLLIVMLYRRLKLANRELAWLPLAGLCVIAVMLVDSLGDPTFFEWRAVTLAALIIGPALVIDRLRGKEEPDTPGQLGDFAASLSP